MVYRIGLASTTAASNVVTFGDDIDGNSPMLLSFIEAGDLIVFKDDGVSYMVGSVDSDTQLTLTANYPTTREDIEFEISSGFTPFLNLPLVTRGSVFPEVIINRALMLLDYYANNIGGSKLKLFTIFLGLDDTTTPASNETKWDIPENYQVVSAKIIKANTGIAATQSRITLSDKDIGGSGATTLQVSVASGAKSGDVATGTIPFPEGGTLRAYIASGDALSGHSDIQLQITLELIPPA